MAREKENLDVAIHSKLDLDFDKEAIKSLTGSDVFNVIIEEKKKEKKDIYVKYIKNAILEYNALEKEIAEMRKNPDLPEEVNPETGQIINQARMSKEYYHKIKDKVRRVNEIVTSIKLAKEGKFESLEKAMKNAK